MIKSFGDKVTAQIWARAPSKRLPQTLQQRALRKLRFLDAATALSDLAAVPRNRLEKLRGAWASFHAIRVDGRHRIWFRWEDGHAWDVRFGDYHDEL